MSGYKCDHGACAGHWGKFPDCLTEALSLASMNGMDETTGSVDWAVHVTLMTFDEPEVMFIDVFNTNTITVPPGVYLLFCNDQGRVWHTAYTDAAIARERFSSLDQEYGAWLGSDDDWG